MMVSERETLHAHYETNFILMYQHKMSLTELNEMMPFERDVYLMMLAKQIQDEKTEENKK
jgi:hypothetical protein